MRASAQRTAWARLGAMPAVISVSRVSRSSGPRRAITGVRLLDRFLVRAVERLHWMLAALGGGRRCNRQPDRDLAWFDHRVVAVLQHRDGDPRVVGEAFLDLLLDEFCRLPVHVMPSSCFC